MKVAIHQPHYLPWCGYLAKWAAADAWVFLDTVQYTKGGYQNRTRIKTAHGPQWLTIPVRTSLGTRLDQVEVVDGPWPLKHLRTLDQAYAGAPYKARSSVYAGQGYRALVQVATASVMMLVSQFKLRPHWAAMSANPHLDDSDPAQRLVNIVQALGGDTYLAGAGSRGYLDLRLFKAAGIQVLVQDYTCVAYPQLHGPFVSHLSALDLLLNCGPDQGREVLLAGDKWTEADW